MLKLSFLASLSFFATAASYAQEWNGTFHCGVPNTLSASAISAFGNGQIQVRTWNKVTDASFQFSKLTLNSDRSSVNPTVLNDFTVKGHIISQGNKGVTVKAYPKTYSKVVQKIELAVTTDRSSIATITTQDQKIYQMECKVTRRP